MKYKTILAKEQNLLFLMRRLGLLSEIVEVKRINHHPDYDYSEYKGPENQTYFFMDEQSIPNELFSVYDAEIIGTRILHSDDIRELSETLNLDVDPEEDEEWILAQAVASDESFIDDLGWDSLTQFTLRHLEITKIENIENCISLQGSFEGDGYGISQPDWALYAVIRFKGFTEDFNEGEFYRQLLAESYQLRQKNDHRVGFFLAYSALEGFINRKLGAETDSDRLSEKVRELFRQSFPGIELARHQIYTNVINDFNNTLTSIRNGIAHGRLIAIDQDQSRHMLLVALMLICSVEFHVETFAQLFALA